MTAKDVLLLLRLRHQSPVARSKLKFLNFFDKKAYLDAKIFFNFSNSEFINDNTFSLKDKKKRYRNFNLAVDEILLWYYKGNHSKLVYLVNNHVLNNKLDAL